MAGRKPQAVDLSRYPSEGSFQTLLNWHLAWGTRPGCDTSRQNRKWIKATFATLVHEEGLDPEYAARGLRFWTNAGVLPDQNDEDKLARIFRELFGDDPHLEGWKADLQRALERDRAAKPKGGAPAKPLVPAARVPRPTSHFVGRDDEVDHLAATLAAGSNLAVLLQGGPGIGKTELTKAIANDSRVVERFRERRWFVPLATATTAEAMRDTLVRVVGSSSHVDFDEALQSLAEKPALLILDNLETPWEPVEQRTQTEAVLTALAQMPGVSLLGSFRGQEWLAEPGWTCHFVEALSADSADRLFSQIAGRWVLADAHLAGFTEALGGIPLAINLVARRAHGRRTLESLWREWKRIGSDLAVNPDLTDGPTTSLNTSIEFSLRSPRMRKSSLKLFRFLGHLPLGITNETIAKLFESERFSSQEGLFKVGLALERNGRVDLLPPLRDYALRVCKLNESEMLELAAPYYEIINDGIEYNEDLKLFEEWDNVDSIVRLVGGTTLQRLMYEVGFG